MVGGDLPTSDAWTVRLLTNAEALAVNQSGRANRQLFHANGLAAWTAVVGRREADLRRRFQRRATSPPAGSRPGWPSRSACPSSASPGDVRVDRRLDGPGRPARSGASSPPSCPSTAPASTALRAGDMYRLRYVSLREARGQERTRSLKRGPGLRLLVRSRMPAKTWVPLLGEDLVPSLGFGRVSARIALPCASTSPTGRPDCRSSSTTPSTSPSSSRRSSPPWPIPPPPSGPPSRSPIGSPPLSGLVRPGMRVGVVFSDITRPAPNPLLLGAVLEVLDAVPGVEIVLFNALGTHRPNTEAELRAMVGDAVFERRRIVQNDAFDPSTQVRVGVTSKGHETWLNAELMRLRPRRS
ncbi:MAG: lactate racemase domain-containing protein [Sphingobacterium sp.]|nr:lactate racemase domain-containing protein [Sphingobacterium sp.]